MPTPQYVIFHSAGLKWNHEKPFLEQDGIMDHAQYYFDLHDEGKVETGGPFLTVNGGMMVLSEGVSLEEASEIASADPGYKSDLVVFDIRLWLPAIKA